MATGDPYYIHTDTDGVLYYNTTSPSQDYLYSDTDGVVYFNTTSPGVFVLKTDTDSAAYMTGLTGPVLSPSIKETAALLATVKVTRPVAGYIWGHADIKASLSLTYRISAVLAGTSSLYISPNSKDFDIIASPPEGHPMYATGPTLSNDKKEGKDVHLPRAGREYANGVITGLPADATLEASFDGSAWHPMVRQGDDIRILIAGPDATGNPANTVVLDVGSYPVTIRSIEYPEDIIRFWGTINVY